MLLKKLFPVVVLLCCSFTALCQGESKVEAYINQYKEIAIREMQRTGVPAAITLAQGILESQNGESELAKKSNNHFGIKCKTEWTGARTYHDDDEKGECFRVYNSVEDSYIDHSDFLKNRPYYSFLFKLDPTDYEGWAKGLKKAGYATSPTYPQQLISLIQRYKLQDYTLLAIQRGKEQESAVFAYAAKTDTVRISADTFFDLMAVDTVKPSMIDTTGQASLMVIVNESEETKEAAVAPVKTAPVFNAADYPGGPFSINGTKVIFVKEGTSLLALANEFGVSYKKLQEFNELDDNTDILPYDQLVFLAKKGKKGSKDIHLVTENETIEIISQKEGVQLEALLAYNRIPKGKQPATGERIYLKANSPVTPKLAASK